MAALVNRAQSYDLKDFLPPLCVSEFLAKLDIEMCISLPNTNKVVLGITNYGSSYISNSIMSKRVLLHILQYSEETEFSVLYTYYLDKDDCLLGCFTVLPGGSLLTFQRRLLPPSSEVISLKFADN
jgi:hypothetical protein